MVESTVVRGPSLARLALVLAWQRAANRQPGSHAKLVEQGFVGQTCFGLGRSKLCNPQVRLPGTKPMASPISQFPHYFFRGELPALRVIPLHWEYSCSTSYCSPLEILLLYESLLFELYLAIHNSSTSHYSPLGNTPRVITLHKG